MGDYPMPSFDVWQNQDVMKFEAYQDSTGKNVYDFDPGMMRKTAESRLAMYEPMESMDGGGGGETWQVGLRRLENEMEIDMLRFELEDAVLDPETNTEEGAAFGKATVAPASASLVNRKTFFEPFDIGQSRTYHNLKTNKDGKPRLYDGAAFMKAALDSSQK